MDKMKNVTLNDDGELIFDVDERKSRKPGCLKAFLFVLYTIFIIVVTVFATGISVEPFEDWWLDSRCDRTLVLDVISNPATLRIGPDRSYGVVGFAEAGPRHIVLDTLYNKRTNDCWAKLEVNDKTGWVLTLLDKQ